MHAAAASASAGQDADAAAFAIAATACGDRHLAACLSRSSLQNERAASSRAAVPHTQLEHATTATGGDTAANDNSAAVS